ncbi:MAG: radical SAM protein [Candidatus Fermentibacteraceae bacterium]|nr:radical SAM protein [Candidatus Fermentibacteraceae bacterium]
MRVTFVDSPIQRGERVPERVFGCTYGLYPIPNIFLLYSAATLEKAGHEAAYINCPQSGIGLNEFQRYLKDDQSDAYVFYSVNLSREVDRRARSIIRRIRGGDIPIVSIGPAPTYYVMDFLDDGNTFVIRGEPELVLPRLLERRSDPSELAGVSFLREGELASNDAAPPVTDLDSLPYPARHLLKPGDYFNPKFRDCGGLFTAVLTSRGCPYRCVFCVPNSLSFSRELEYRKEFGRKPPYRARSAGSVVDEFRMLKEEGYSCISIIDDEFVIDRQRTVEICAGIAGLGITWGCLARADSIDGELAGIMSDAGCEYVDIGVESLDQRILDDIRKDIDADTIRNSVSSLRESGIFTKLNILLGSSPLENRTSVRNTVDAAIAMRPDSIMFSICNPFPGTELYHIAMEKGYFHSGDYYPVDVQKSSTVSLPMISRHELERELRRANRRFFLSPALIARNLWRLRHPAGFLRVLNVLRKKLF